MIKSLNWADVINDMNDMRKRIQESVIVDVDARDFYSADNAFHNVVFRKINEIIEQCNKNTKRLEELEYIEYRIR